MEDLKLYELNCLLNPKLEIDQIKEWSQQINEFISKNLKEEKNEQEKNSVIRRILEIEENISKTTLSYPVKKTDSAFFYSTKFLALPQKIKLLEEKLKSDQRVLRFRIFSQKIRKPKIPQEILYKKPVLKTQTSLKKETPKKVEIEKVDEKLKELLGE